MVDAGNDHSVLLSTDGDVYVWGGSSEGQLGVGEDDQVREPRKLNMNEKVRFVACGYYHTAFVTESGKLLTCGESEGGKLGHGDDTDSVRVPTVVGGIDGRVVRVACGGSQTIAVTDRGKAYSFGDGANGQLGHGTMVLACSSPQQITALTDHITHAYCGENHTALVSKKGSLYTFGDGRHGKLALGDENFANQFKPCLVHRFKQFSVESASCGGCHTLVCASLSHMNGHVGSGSDSAIDEVDNPITEPLQKKTQLSKSNHLYDSMDLEGSIGARNRRREKFPENDGTIHRTLPPLNSSNINRTSLPSFESTQLNSAPLWSNRNNNHAALNSLSVAPIQNSKSPSLLHTLPVTAAAQKTGDDSGGSDLSDSEEEESDDEPASKQQLKFSKSSELDRKPKPVPRRLPEPLKSNSLPKITKTDTVQTQSKPKRMDEGSEEEEDDYSESEQETDEEDTKPKTKVQVQKAVKGKVKTKMEEDAASKHIKHKKELKEKSKKDSKKAPVKKHTLGSGDHTESETESEKDLTTLKQSAKKAKKKKEIKKRTSIFGKKKALESDEESDEETEDKTETEEDLPKSKKETEKEDKSKKKEKEDKKEKDKKKDDDKDDKKKEKEDKKKTKKEKEKDKKVDKKSKDKKDDKKKQDDDEDEEESDEEEKSGVDEEAKSIHSDDSKADKEEEPVPLPPPPPKKSGLCCIL